MLLKEQSDLGPHHLPVCKNRFENVGQHKQTTFSDAGFLGIFRANSVDLFFRLESLSFANIYLLQSNLF